MNTLNNPGTAVPAGAATPGVPRFVWALVALMAVAIAALAGAMTWKTLATPAAPEPVATVIAPAPEPAASAAFIAPNDGVPPEPLPAPVAKAQPAPVPKPKPRPAPAKQPAPVAQAPAPAPAPLPVVVCHTCGVVEAVSTVQQKGEATGLGAVAGGVLGGVLGHQVGGGNGRKAATVIGAIGGGLAGNEVEKHARSETLYHVRVRMDDGTSRVITQKTAPSVGQKVTVDGSTLRAQGGNSY